MKYNYLAKLLAILKEFETNKYGCKDKQKK